ncbi:MAG: hypothetical protein MZV70_10720 [Desulfobacterales bacterium]|nr:hypothetical protein [Desulfobacterales bacterium]
MPGRIIPIDADLTDDIIKATINGRDVMVGFRIISANQIHLEVDGIGINAYLTDNQEGKLINVVRHHLSGPGRRCPGPNRP